jgi:acyl-CoA thioester hydrolase
MPQHDSPAQASPEHTLLIEATHHDIDELGHVSNITYVRWIQDAAKSHSAAVGWDSEAYFRHGGVFVVRRHEIDYLAPALLGDRIELRTHVANFTAATSERKTRVVRAADGADLARAITTWVFVSTSTQRPCRIPAEIREAFLGGFYIAGG